MKRSPIAITSEETCTVLSPKTWVRGQTQICGLFCEFVAPLGKEKLAAIMSQGHVLEAWKPMLYRLFLVSFL